MSDAIKCPRCKGAGVITRHPVETLRLRKGLNQKDAAAALGVGQSALSRIEAGMSIPWKHHGTWADFFGVTRAQLLGREPLPAAKAPRPTRAPPAGAVAASRAHRAKVKATQKNKAKRNRP